MSNSCKTRRENCLQVAAAPVTTSRENCLQVARDTCTRTARAAHYRTMAPVFRPHGWKAGASGIDKVANRLLIGIGLSLLALRFAHATIYAEKWTKSDDNTIKKQHQH